MSYIVTACWTTADGLASVSVAYSDLPTMTEVEAKVREGFARARRMQGTDIRVLVMDDIPGRIVAKVRPK